MNDVEKLKRYYDVVTDKDLCDKTGIKAGTVSSWISRNAGRIPDTARHKLEKDLDLPKYFFEPPDMVARLYKDIFKKFDSLDAVKQHEFMADMTKLTYNWGEPKNPNEQE